jgi:hypothetical protein
MTMDWLRAGRESPGRRERKEKLAATGAGARLSDLDS